MIDVRTIQGNPAIRYGFYLRPPYAMSKAQIDMHVALERQFGLIGGGVFMPHATIKGLFRSDASIDELCTAIDYAVLGHQPFDVINGGIATPDRRSIFINTHLMEDGSVNEPQHQLHHDVFSALKPLIHPDCDFTPREWAEDRFFAHHTLAMSDLEEWFFDEVWAYVRAAEPIGPPSFTAEWFSLYAFQSDAWDGPWWESLEWRLLRSWKLGHR